MIRHLPRPQLVEGRAVAGICLIRLGSLRPKGLPASLGVTTENAAHRIAVEWDQDGESWYCRELFRADVAGGAVSQLSVYCTGDWDQAQVARHRETVELLRR